MKIGFTLNDEAVTVEVAPQERLLDVLRYRLGLTGSKEGCGEGECGACSVHIDGLPANACLVPAFQVRGREVVTVESSDDELLRPLLETGATQCGACTPGVVMTARWVRDNPGLLERFTPRQLMAGNLCRCTGYDGIVDGLLQALGRPVEPKVRIAELPRGARAGDSGCGDPGDAHPTVGEARSEVDGGGAAAGDGGADAGPARG